MKTTLQFIINWIHWSLVAFQWLWCCPAILATISVACLGEVTPPHQLERTTHSYTIRGCSSM